MSATVLALVTRRRGDTGPLLWAGGAVALAALLGVLSAQDSPQAAAAPMLLVGVVLLLLRPALMPPLLVVTMFAEALAVGGVTIARLVGPLCVLVLVLAAATRRLPGLPDRRILLASGAYAVWAFTSTLWTVDGDLAPGYGTGKALVSLAISLVFMLGAALLLEDRRQLVRLLVVVWVMSVIMGAVAIAEFLNGSARAAGVSGDANFFASVQVLAVPLGAVLASQVESGRIRVIVLLGLAVSVGSVMTSLSRGGILALVAVFLLLAVQPARGFFRTRGRKIVFLAVACVGALALLAASYSALSARTSSLFTTGDGGSGRANLWRAAVTGWRPHPIRGLGFGAFEGQSNSLLLRTPGVDFTAYKLRPTGQPVHSAYLGSLAELGVVGVALFVGFLVSIIATLRRAARRAKAAGNLFLSAVARALVLSVTAFAVTSLFLSSETNRAIWVIAGVALAVARLAATGPSPSDGPMPLLASPRPSAVPQTRSGRRP